MATENLTFFCTRRSIDTLRLDTDGINIFLVESTQPGCFTVRTSTAYDSKVHNINISERGRELEVTARSNGCSRRSGFAGRTMSIINGRVVFGGMDDRNNLAADPPDIYIGIPCDATSFECAINANASNQSEIDSRVALGNVHMTLHGQTTCNLREGCKRLKVKTSSQATMRADSVCGHINAECSGQSEVIITGVFESANIECSDQSKVRSHGPCTGDYMACASGMSEITHPGEVRGAVRRGCSGMSTVNVGSERVTSDRSQKKRHVSISSSSSDSSDSSIQEIPPPKRSKPNSYTHQRETPPSQKSEPPRQKTAEDTAFEVIGILKTERWEIIRAVYLQKAKLLHPDKGAKDDVAFKELQNAYELLGRLYNK